MNHTNNAIWQKEVLISELNDIYALVEVCHGTLKSHNVLGLESVETVLNVTYDRIFAMSEQERKRLEAIKEQEQEQEQE